MSDTLRISAVIQISHNRGYRICTRLGDFKCLSHLHHLRRAEDSHLGAEKESYDSEETEQLLVGKICGESLPVTFVSGFFSRQTGSCKNVFHLPTIKQPANINLSGPPYLRMLLRLDNIDVLGRRSN